MTDRDKKILPLSFYIRNDVVQISKDLLGKFLVTRFNGQITAGKIVETEAYRGPDDKACHAWNYRRTRRTEIMYRQGGVAYVYLCYGIHHMFNVVTGKEEMPHAILIRAIEPADNVELMLQRRNMLQPVRQLTAGPGVVTQALGIRTEHTGTNLTSADGPIWIEDRGMVVKESEFTATPRVGVDYAGECAAWEWRFRLKNSSWTSKPD
jgi:DNA-3-methyladenine glycosylase